MINISDLHRELCAVCYTYGDSGDLFLHCFGQGLSTDDEFYIDRDDDPFFISPDWDVVIKIIPEDKKEKLGGADYLIAIRVLSLDSLDKSKMDLILCSSESHHLIEGYCEYSDQTLNFIHNESQVPFIIYRDWYPRIKRCDGDEKYNLLLSVGDLPPDADENEFKQTGIRIPPNE